MRTPIVIRHDYNPIQPIGQYGDKIKHLEVLPDLTLRPFIFCYWELMSCHSFSEDFTANAIPDGCIDIFLEVNNPTKVFVMGFCNRFTPFQFGSSFHYVGIRFSPAMFPYLFKVNASELTNKIEELNLIHFQTAQFIAEHVMPGRNFHELTCLFNSYFLKHLSKLDSDVDSRLYEAVLKILRKPGITSIERDIHANVGVSPRQLRRLFDFYVGDSIKSFSKVVRFQKYLNAQYNGTSSKSEKLYFDFGYYDQTHFIKEFKNFYGKTPGVAFK